MFDYDRTDDRLTLRRPGTHWLSTGLRGGYRTADAAHNLTVPEGFERTDLPAYADERLEGLPSGPTLLTGVQQSNARGASRGPVVAVATVGLSNPAVLAVGGEFDSESKDESEGMGRDQSEGTGRDQSEGKVEDEGSRRDVTATDGRWRPGTVNVILGTTRALDDAALAELLATAVEAKTATLQATADVTGTTSDAVVVGCDPDGDRTAFAGSATEVGTAARLCVRDAILAGLDSRYGEDPPTPASADHGVLTKGSTNVFEP